MTDSPAEFLRTFAAEFDRRFDTFLSAADAPAELREAVRYTALAPGKRIRPYLVVRCCELVGGRRDDAWSAAAAIECVHAFSLVHDDLPAMDNDDFRRGRPTTHKQFTEATAILAGDALLAFAFEILVHHAPYEIESEDPLAPPTDPAGADGCKAQTGVDRGYKAPLVVNKMVLELARAAGMTGIVGGQAADVAGERAAPAEELVKYIHERKTARLFEAACRLGALAGHGAAKSVKSLACYGRRLGLAFQIADDLLDVSGSLKEIGKNTGKDATAGKQTYPRCVGVESSRIRAAAEVQAAISELAAFPDAADLRSLAAYAASRNY